VKPTGEAAIAEVYRVRQRLLGRQTMKVLKQPGVTEETGHRRPAEAILLSQLGHPDIVRVFDAKTFSHRGEGRGSPWNKCRRSAGGPLACGGRRPDARAAVGACE
jgi:hypothetical protein